MEEAPNPLARAANKQEARKQLGEPMMENQPVTKLPAAYQAELEKSHLLNRAKSWDKFKQFRVATSLPATPGVYFWYVIYDDKDVIVTSFKQLVD